MPSKRPAPLRPTATASVGAYHITVQWAMPPGSGPRPLEYELQYGFRMKGSWRATSSMSDRPDAETRMVSSLKPNDKYVFRVRARFGDGWGDWSKKSDTITTLSEDATGGGADSSAGMGTHMGMGTASGGGTTLDLSEFTAPRGTLRRYYDVTWMQKGMDRTMMKFAARIYVSASGIKLSLNGVHPMGAAWPLDAVRSFGKSSNTRCTLSVVAMTDERRDLSACAHFADVFGGDAPPVFEYEFMCEASVTKLIGSALRLAIEDTQQDEARNLRAGMGISTPR